MPKKLGIRPADRIALVNAPSGFETLLGDLPPGVRIARGIRGKNYDLVHLFARQAGQLREIPTLAKKMTYEGALWVSWPKKSSGVTSDVDENLVRKVGLAAGLVDVKVCAVDEVWSGLKLVYRLKDRPARMRKQK